MRLVAMLNGADSITAAHMYADHELVGLHLFDDVDVFRSLKAMMRATSVMDKLNISAVPMDISHFSKNRLACIIMYGVYFAESNGCDGVVIGATPEFGYTKLLALQRVVEMNGSTTIIAAPLISRTESNIKDLRRAINL